MSIRTIILTAVLALAWMFMIATMIRGLNRKWDTLDAVAVGAFVAAAVMMIIELLT